MYWKYWKYKDSWKSLLKALLSFFSLNIPSTFSFPTSSLQQAKNWNKPCKPLNTSAFLFFFFFEKEELSELNLWFSIQWEKTFYSFCRSVPIQSSGTTCISHPRGYGLAAAHQPGSNRKTHSKRHPHRSTCAVQVTGIVLRLLTQSCQTEQQVTGESKDWELEKQSSQGYRWKLLSCCAWGWIIWRKKVTKCLESKKKLLIQF